MQYYKAVSHGFSGTERFSASSHCNEVRAGLGLGVVTGHIRVTQFHSKRYEPHLPAVYREYDGDSEFIE
jgi:hypothetical protein